MSGYYQSCFDCKASGPTWASSNLGLFLCYNCAGTHRGFGVATSFVRSWKLDKWTRKQLRSMEMGGNERAFKYFNKHGVLRPDGKPDYHSTKLNKYRQDLKKETTLSLAQEGFTQAPSQKPTTNHIESETKLVFQTKSQTSPAEQRKQSKPLAAASLAPVTASLGLMNQGAEKLGAKKVDQVFDEDFFDQILNSKAVEPTPLKFVQVQKKEPELPKQPISFPKTQQSLSSTQYFSREDRRKQAEASQKLSEFKGKDRISSTDVFGVEQGQVQNNEQEEDYVQMAAQKVSEWGSSFMNFIGSLSSS